MRPAVFLTKGTNITIVDVKGGAAGADGQDGDQGPRGETGLAGNSSLWKSYSNAPTFDTNTGYGCIKLHGEFAISGTAVVGKMLINYISQYTILLKLLIQI